MTSFRRDKNQELWKRRYLQVTLTVATAALLLFPGNNLRAALEDEILADNPFAYWRFAEPVGSTEAVNLGSGDVPANFDGNVTLGVAGPAERPNGSAFFDGDGSLVRVPDSGLINTSNGPWEEKTIELWFNAPDVDVESEQVLYEQGGTTRGLNIYIREGNVFVGGWNRANDDSGMTTPWISGEDDPTGGNLYLSTPIEDRTTYHVALVLDGDTAGMEGTLSGYLNGELFGEKTGVGQIFNHGDDVGIGGMDTSTFFDSGGVSGDGNFFRGAIDEVALYNVALPADRIAARYAARDTTPAGDFNNDGTIDLADFEIMRSNFRQRGGFADGNINFDPDVDLFDFLEFAEAFNAQPAGAPVPEPASWCLMVFTALALWLGARKRH